MRLLYVLAALLLPPLTGNAQEVTVFAAASLTDAMKDISAKWVEAGHPALRMSFGSSSTLARQIEQGAPANVFASADEKWMDYLADKKLIVADTRKSLLGNDLVLVVAADKPRHVTINKASDLAGLLGPNGRLATGDPAHVPVGIYAEQALKKLGLWDSVSTKLARTEDMPCRVVAGHRNAVRKAPAGVVYYATDAAVSKSVDTIAGVFPAKRQSRSRCHGILSLSPNRETRADCAGLARSF